MRPFLAVLWFLAGCGTHAGIPVVDAAAPCADSAPTCGCETVEEICARLQSMCGAAEAIDANCHVLRTVGCGSCPGNTSICDNGACL